MSRLLLLTLLASYLCLFNTGCVFMHKEHLKTQDGYLVEHLKSCGPKALQKVSTSLKDDRLKSAGEKIQDTGNLSRIFLSMFNYRAIEITFTYEIKNLLEDLGYKVFKAENIESLKEGDVALVLVRGNFFSKEWHWLCYPVDKESINSFFGKNTKTHLIFIIKKV